MLHKYAKPFMLDRVHCVVQHHNITGCRTTLAVCMDVKFDVDGLHKPRAALTHRLRQFHTLLQCKAMLSQLQCKPGFACLRKEALAHASTSVVSTVDHLLMLAIGKDSTIYGGEACLLQKKTRQTKKQRNQRESKKETKKQRDKGTTEQRSKETKKQRNKATNNQPTNQTNKEASKQTNTQTINQSFNQTIKQTNKQTNISGLFRLLVCKRNLI